MPLLLTRYKINEIDTEVVVCPYGIDDKDYKHVQEEIYSLAGNRLYRSVQQKHSNTSVFMTPSFDLNKDYICHVLFGKKSILHYYKMCLDITLDYQCKKIAFPLYDSKEIDTIVSFFGDYLQKHDMTIYLYTEEDLNPYECNKVLDSYIHEQSLIYEMEAKKAPKPDKTIISGVDMIRLINESNNPSNIEVVKPVINNNTFYEQVFKYVDEKGLSDYEVYKRANLTQDEYFNIAENPEYKPSMHTTLAFAVALSLTMDQTEDLLKRAGYSFNKASKLYFLFDYFFKNDIYDIYRINTALFEYHFKTLGI